MISEQSHGTSNPGIPVFGIACWLLGLMAFSQLIVAGIGLADRMKASQRIQIVEKEVIKEVRVPGPVEHGSGPTDHSAHPFVSPPVPKPEIADVPSVPPTPLNIPQVADPASRRLFLEAREARVAGDMGKAIIKLEQAHSQSPDDPNVLYELGLVHEQMGVFDKASEYFEQVFQMGVSKAGALYEMAAAKLRDGFAQPDDMLGKLALGRVRIFNNPKHQDGQQVILTIPVQKAPGEQVDVAGIEVEVRFFNKTTRGDIIEGSNPGWVKNQWCTLPFDWNGGEECLRMTYTVPPQDIQTEHLFGGRSYYGQVVTLTYQGGVLDVQAWPRELAAKISKVPSQGFGDHMAPEFQDALPPDFDPTIPLLPPLPE